MSGVRRRARRAGRTLLAGISNGVTRLSSSPIWLLLALAMVLFTFDGLYNAKRCNAWDAQKKCTGYTAGPSWFKDTCLWIDKSIPAIPVKQGCDFIDEHVNRSTSLVQALVVTSLKATSPSYPAYAAVSGVLSLLATEMYLSVYTAIYLSVFMYFVQKPATSKKMVLLLALPAVYYVYTSGL